MASLTIKTHQEILDEYALEKITEIVDHLLGDDEEDGCWDDFDHGWTHALHTVLTEARERLNDKR